MKNRFIDSFVILIGAFCLRFLLAYIFYGSIDVSAFIGINAHTFNDTLKLHPFSIWCSFPVIPFYLWLCGFLSIKTSLPIAFCFKLIPIFFDSMLAVLVYDIVKKMSPAYALRAGLLYAFSPVALIVTCIHGQWEALPIFFFLLGLYIREFFVDSYAKYFWYGLCFAFSFMLKPLSLIFLLFFFVPYATIKKQLGAWWLYGQATMWLMVAFLLSFFIAFKLHPSLELSLLLHPGVALVCIIVLLFVGLLLFRYRPWRNFSIDFQQYLIYQGMAVAGLCSMVFACFVGFALYGWNVIAIIEKVLRYFNQGIQMFGLPFAYPLNQGIIGVFLKNRFWIMGLIALVAYAYYTKRMPIFNALAASIMIIFSFSGLSPQYLLWAIPFLLITRSYWSVGILNLVITVFCVLYYMNPLANPEVPYQSMASFAALKSFNWLMPPAFFTASYWLPCIHFLGNYLIPVCCMSVALVLYTSKKYVPVLQNMGRFVFYKNGYIVASIAITLVIAGGMLFTIKTDFASLFAHVVSTRFDVYDVHMVGQYPVGNYGATSIFNMGFALLGLGFVWSVVACAMGRYDKRINK